jgi:hypothetical protein
MKLKRKLDKKEEIPSGFEGLYEEKNGSFYLKDIEGLKPIEEFTTLTNSLTEARQALYELNNKYKYFEDKDVSEILKKLDKYDELVRTGKDKSSLTKEDLDKLAEITTAELSRQVKDLTDKLKVFETENTSLKTEKIKAKLKESIDEIVLDKETKDLRVYGGVLKDIQIRAERDLEWNDTLGKFVTKDAEKLDTQSWYYKQIKEGALWEKGSRGEPDGNGLKKLSSKADEGTIEANIAEVWGQAK